MAESRKTGSDRGAPKQDDLVKGYFLRAYFKQTDGSGNKKERMLKWIFSGAQAEADLDLAVPETLGTW